LPNQGFYAVLLRRLLQEVGAVPAFEFLPPLRAYEQVVEGRVDGAFPYKKTPEREQLLWYSEPFYMARWRVFLAAQDPWTPQHTGELKDHGLGCAMQGSPVPDPLRDDAASGALRLQRVTLIDTCFRMLKLGRVRYVLTGENTGWAAVQALPDQSSGLRMAPLVVAEEGVYLTFPRKRPDSVARLQAFNEAVRKLRKSGELRRLEQAWMPRPPAP
jgi:polar amino acid transport system substrate-binding protein